MNPYDESSGRAQIRQTPSGEFPNMLPNMLHNLRSLPVLLPWRRKHGPGPDAGRVPPGE